MNLFNDAPRYKLLENACGEVAQQILAAGEKSFDVTKRNTTVAEIQIGEYILTGLPELLYQEAVCDDCPNAQYDKGKKIYGGWGNGIEKLKNVQ